MEFWENCGIQEETNNLMDWELNEHALQEISISRQHWLTKQVSGMCRVGKMRGKL